MKTYKNILSGEIITEGTVIGKWPDGSDITVEEHVKVINNGLYELYEDMTGVRIAEIFDLATRIMIGHAQAGIKPNVDDAFEVAINAYKIKDAMLCKLK